MKISAKEILHMR